MKTHVLKGASLVAAASLLTAGCSNLTPSQNAAMFGAAGGALAGGIGSAAGMNTGQAIATGLAAGAAISAVTYVIAKHQATERQRQIAQQRARLAYARISTKRKSEPTAHKTRYIAVDTEKDEHTSPQAKKSVMIWDTQSQEVVGNDVYDLKSVPPVGSTAKFETYSAEYVGSGS